MSLDKLSKDTVESGRAHPFVAALLHELKARREHVVRLMVETAWTTAGGPMMHTLGGSAREAERIIRLIEETEGVER